MKLNCFGLSDIGLSRPKNEDVWIAIPENGFFALADGMGGHRAGDIAAQETIDHLTQSMKKVKTQDPSEIIIELHYAIEKANQWIYRMGKKNEALRGMGTTLCCMIWSKKAVIYAHVGDSRIYRLRNQRLYLLTQDHSLLTKWQKTKKKSQTPFPYKNVITKAIGTVPKIYPEISISNFIPNDLFFLCSDGLSDVLGLKDIEKIINNTKDLEIASKELIKTAKIKGSSDNITILMAQLKEQYAKNLLR